MKKYRVVFPFFIQEEPYEFDTREGAIKFVEGHIEHAAIVSNTTNTIQSLFYPESKTWVSIH